MNRPLSVPTADELASAVVDLVDARRLGAPAELAAAVLESFARLVGAGRARIEVDLDERGATLAVERRFDPNGRDGAMEPDDHPTNPWIEGTISLSDGDRLIGTVWCDVEPSAHPAVESVLVLSTHLLVEQRSVDRLTGMVSQLDQALRSRLRIEQAKGVMAERLRVTPEDAFAQLRASARSEHRSVDDVAMDVLDTVSQRRF